MSDHVVRAGVQTYVHRHTGDIRVCKRLQPNPGRINNENMVYLHNGILLRHGKDGILLFCRNQEVNLLEEQDGIVVLVH